MLQIILTKILLGISLAAPIGPLNAEMIKRGLTNGFWGSFSVRLGGIIANSICLLITYFGLGQLVQHPKILFAISCLGEIVLLYIGITTIIKAITKNFMYMVTANNSNGVKHNNYTIKNGLLIGVILAFTSPIGLMFWLTTFAASIQQNVTNNLNITDLLINFFIILGVLLWGTFVSLILHFCSKIIDNKKLRIVSILSGLILIYFGVKYGIASFKNFHNLFVTV